MGVGKLTALPLSTPPDTGFIRGRGAGGGSLFVTTTLREVSSAVFRKSPAGGGTPPSFGFSKKDAGGNAETGFAPAGVGGWAPTSPGGALGGIEEISGWRIFVLAAS